MARRTAMEIMESIRTIAGTAEGVEALLEDVQDSISNVDLKNYVDVKEYDRVVSDLSKTKADYESMRTRYINRFYQGYSNPDQKGYIASEAPEGDIIREEETETRDGRKDPYADLFE